MKKLNWKRTQIWEGSMIATIVHGVMVAHYPELDYEHSWDGINYNIQNGNGVRGTITFHPQYFVAAFRNENLDHPNRKEVLEYLQGAKEEIKTLAESETFQYLLDEIDGEIKPVVTTVLWGETELLSLDKESEIKEKTEEIFDIQTKTPKECFAYWKEYYEMNEEQMELVKQIFEEKKKNPSKRIILTEEQKRMVGTKDEEGLEQSRISFSEINIVLP